MTKKPNQQEVKQSEPLDFSKRLKARFPEFEGAWNKAMREMGHELVNFIQERIEGKRSLLAGLAKFRFKFVVDNNFVFGQIKGAVAKKKPIEKSFIYKLLSSRTIQIYAPPLLQEELYEKINLIIPEDQRDIALGYAVMILSRIEIKDAQWVDNWKTANKLIGEIDEDDVPTLALALEIESHAIMSFDEVFHRQGDVRVWQHGDAEKVITNYNSGFVSFVIVERAGIWLGNILAAIVKFLWNIICEVVELLALIATGAIRALTNIPGPLWILILGLGIAFKDELAQAGKDVLSFIKEKGSEILEGIKAMVRDIYELLKGFLEVAGLAGTVVFEFLGYMMHQYNDMNTHLKEMKFDTGLDLTGATSTKQA
ncbi:MAG: hypothetical protein JNJ75_10520 [Cyclobacteriaceae bacterium]|nr:hypothetical protein [Cyclobacteriaceae bacterium]